jgi:amino acid adenylation domain-containing protein
VFAEPAGIDLAAVFSTEAHTRIDAVRFLERFESTLLAVDARGDVPVGELDIACAKDHEVLARLNSTRRTWPATGGATTAELIYRQGMRSPDADAVAPWSYARLLRKAAGLARALREAGVAPGDVVAQRQVRGPELAASALAVWTVGAAYLPMDPAHPVERGLAEVTAAGARVLIAGPDAPPEFGAAGTVLDAIAMPEAEPVPPAPGRIAYLIHTSGSTGRPKAVQITHANLANVVLHFLDALRITAVDRVLWSTTFSFDISALEVFMPLLAGGCCVPATDRDRVSPRVLAALIQAERVSVAQGTPTLWRHLAPGLGNSLRGKTVLCGGEPLTRALAATLLGTGCRLVNVYGPTETTIWSTAAEITEPPPPRIPLGAPIANTRIAVRDVGGRAVPLGTPGELHVGGTGVADGYRSDERLTGERFGKDAVLGRFYRTGDRVILQADGTLTFLGRQDRQVKIRGHRLELGEVEAALERHEEVAAAAAFVTRDPDSGAARLAAAVRLGRPHAAAVTERLREHAHDLLPAAAVPERVLIVDRFPLTGNGKIDYQALVADERHRARDCAPRAEPPPGSRLAVLVGAWREILRDGTVDAETHFFLAGGHSLAAVRLAERLSGLLGVPLGFEKIFETPTPAELERSLAGTGG